MEASSFPTPQHDEGEERDVRSDLETLKKLYGLLDKTVAVNSESNNEEILDHKSRKFLMKLLDEATQHTFTRQIKMLPGPLLTPQLANVLSIQRSGRSTNEGLEQNHDNCLRHSVQRGDSNLLKSQFSIKSRKSQAHNATNQAPSPPHHPMSRYPGRSGIGPSARSLIGGITLHQCQKERSLYCPSEHQPNSKAFKTAELTPKRILASPIDRTDSTLRPVRLDRVSSRPEHMNLQVVPYKIKNQNLETEKDNSSDGTTSSRESKSQMLHQRKTNKFTKRTMLHKRLPVIDPKEKPGENLPVVSSSQSNSVTDSESSRNSSSSSKQRLPMVVQKPSHSLRATHSKRHLISQSNRNKPLQKIRSRNSSSSSKRRSSLVVQKPNHPLRAIHSKRHSQHDHNKPLQRIQDTRQEFVSSQRNLKKPAKVTDMPEQKKGRLKRLKEKLAIVLHHRHDHHLHHYHHSGEDEPSKGRASKHHDHHRSLWKYLKGIVHHSSEHTAEIVPPQQHHHRHVRALFRMLFGHLWGNKRRKKARLGRTGSRVRVNKLRWWQKFRRGGPMKLTNGRNARLRLRNGDTGGTKKRGNKR